MDREAEINHKRVKVSIAIVNSDGRSQTKFSGRGYDIRDAILEAWSAAQDAMSDAISQCEEIKEYAFGDRGDTASARVIAEEQENAAAEPHHGNRPPA